MSMTVAELKAMYSVDETPLQRSLAGLPGMVGRVNPPGIKLDGDASGVDRAVGQAQASTGRLGSAMKTAAASMAGYFAFDAVKNFVSGTIGAASDLNETVNKSNTIFGASSGVINQWAKGAAQNLGLSRQQALDAAAGFGDMFSQIGFAGDQAANMSKQVVQMSADLGSFNNLPTDDVAQRISAAFRGEYDSLQALIPNINAARVESEAMAATGKKNASSLTAQEKAAAVLAIVHKDGARAMGDFAKTSDGLANKQKILAARWEDQKAKIGNALLPIMNTLVGFLTDKALPALERVGGFLKDVFGPAFDTVKAAIGPFIAAFSDGGGKASGAMGRITEAVKSVVAFVGPAFETVKAIFGDFVTIVTGLWHTFGDTIVSFLATTWENVKTVLGGALDVIKGILDVFIGIFTGDWSRAWDGVKSIFSGVWDIIKGAFGQILNVMGTIASAFLDAIKAVFSAGWNAIKDGVSAAWNAISGAVSGAWRNISGAVSAGISNVISWVAGLPGRIMGAIGNLGSLLLNAGRDLLTGLWNGIQAAGSWLWGKVKSFFGNLLPGWVRDMLGIHSPSTVFAEMGRYLMLGMASGIQSEQSTAVKAALAAAGAITDAMQVSAPDLSAMANRQAMAGLTARRPAGVGVSSSTPSSAADAVGAPSFDKLLNVENMTLVEGDAQDVARQLDLQLRTRPWA